MTYTRKTFNVVVNYIKKVEGVKQVGQQKVLAKKYQNVGNFGGFYSMGS